MDNTIKMLDNRGKVRLLDRKLVPEKEFQRWLKATADMQVGDYYPQYDQQLNPVKPGEEDPRRNLRLHLKGFDDGKLGIIVL